MTDREAASVALFARHEERMLALGTRRLPVPVLLVSGSLGTGKTTLLNHILNNKLNLRVTCLVNDLAVLNIDAALLVKRDAARKTVHLSNGCACHSLSGQFEAEMWQVLQETEGTERTDYVVVETSGVADPLRLIESLERRFGKMTRARLDGVIVMVDSDVLSHQLRSAAGAELGKHAVVHPDEPATPDVAAAAARRILDAAGPALSRQLQCADVIILNKADLLNAEDMAALQSHVGAAAPWAKVHSAICGTLPLQLLLNVDYCQGGSDGFRMAHDGIKGSFLTGESSLPSSRAERLPAVEPLPLRSTPQADAELHGFRAVEFTSDQPLRLADFQDLIAAAGCPSDGAARCTRDDVETADGEPSSGASTSDGLRPAYMGLWRRVHRVKGVVWFEECRSERWVFHLAGRQRVHLQHDGQWQTRPQVQLVAIGQQWEQGAARLLAALRAMCAPATPPSRALGVVSSEAGDAADSAADHVARDEGEVVCEPCLDPSHEAARLLADMASNRRIVAADRRFELVQDLDDLRRSADDLGAGLLHFQLVGAALFGISRAELEGFHRGGCMDSDPRCIRSSAFVVPYIAFTCTGYPIHCSKFPHRSGCCSGRVRAERHLRPPTQRVDRQHRLRCRRRLQCDALPQMARQALHDGRTAAQSVPCGPRAIHDAAATASNDSTICTIAHATNRPEHTERCSRISPPVVTEVYRALRRGWHVPSGALVAGREPGRGRRARAGVCSSATLQM